MSRRGFSQVGSQLPHSWEDVQALSLPLLLSCPSHFPALQTHSVHFNRSSPYLIPNQRFLGPPFFSTCCLLWSGCPWLPRGIQEPPPVYHLPWVPPGALGPFSSLLVPAHSLGCVNLPCASSPSRGCSWNLIPVSFPDPHFWSHSSQYPCTSPLFHCWGPQPTAWLSAAPEYLRPFDVC